jgi:serine/threonine-protein kinase
VEIIRYRIDAALKSRSGTGTVWLLIALAMLFPGLFMLAVTVAMAFDRKDGGIGVAFASFIFLTLPFFAIAYPCFRAYQRASAEVGAGRALLDLATLDATLPVADAVQRVAQGRAHVLQFLANMQRQGWFYDLGSRPAQAAAPAPALGMGNPNFGFAPNPVPVPVPVPVAGPIPAAMANTPFPGQGGPWVPPPYGQPASSGNSPVASGPIGSAMPPTPLHGGFAAQPVAFVPGTVIADRWRIERLLGEGGMGAVFVVAHTRTAKKYALKVILGDGARSEQAVARFEREALTVSGLRHPGIVQVHDYDRAADGSPYLVMDLLDGEPLDSRLERLGSVPYLAARQWVVEAARALAVAHEKGLVHRDIKPGNLFLAQDGSGSERIVVLDFGVVKTADEPKAMSLTRTGAPIGTPMYMAPEQFRGDGVDGRADVWALATVLYQLVAGKGPFPAESMAELTVAVLTQPVPPVASVAQRPVPPGLDAFFARALAKDKNQRFSTFAEFEAALLAVS